MFDRMLDFGFVIFVDVGGGVGVSSTTALLFEDALFDFLPDMTSRRFVVSRGGRQVWWMVGGVGGGMTSKRLPRGPLIP